MSRLDEALDRLERAVARLEKLLAAGPGAAATPAARGQAEGAAENRRLREAAGEIGARVDQALATVGRTLQGER
jgi:hypothetical protein